MHDVPTPEPHPYRIGYREGFRDGFAESDRLQNEADDKKKSDPDGDEAAGGDKKGDDKKGDDETEDGDKANSGEDGDGKDSDDKGKDKDKNKDKEDEKDDGKPPLYKRPLIVGGALLVVLLLILVAIIFWRHSKSHETTDDAFIDGQVIQLAAQTTGRVQKVYVTDNQLVEAGDPLVDIDARDNDTRIAQSRAQLATAEGQVEQADAQVGVQRANAAQADASIGENEAQLTKAVQDLARYRAVDPDAVPRQQVDAATAQERTARSQLNAARLAARAAHAQIDTALAQVRSGKAQVEAARANLASAQVQTSYTHVTAPVRGRVSKRSVEPGNVISNGQALMAIVSEALWITANYKETQLTYMKPGLKVEISVDAFPDLIFHGHVDSIQRGTGSYFSMLPAENATGNYVKVVQRVPVKIVFDDDAYRKYAIGPGMSVKPDVSLP